jgi:hypothetical protein
LAPGQCSILKNVPNAKAEKATVGIFVFIVFLFKPSDKSTALVQC